MASPHPRRHRAGILLSLLLAALFVGGTAGAAQAADGYRYWNYFHVKNGAFAFATTGSSGFVPKDGDTEAYRFGTSTPQQGITPRADLARLGFDKVCADTAPQTGKKRVAVLLDYGTPADADGAEVPDPRAACALVAEKANGQQVLDAVADLRASKGMICGVDGYPASGCGDAVKDATPATDEKTVDFALPAAQADTAATKDVSAQSAAGNTPLLVGGAVVVLLLAGGGYVLARRSRNA